MLVLAVAFALSMTVIGFLTGYVAGVKNTMDENNDACEQ